jgi:hypothetical protein
VTDSLNLYGCPEIRDVVPREAMSRPLPGWRADYDPVTDQFAVVQPTTGLTRIYTRAAF